MTTNGEMMQPSSKDWADARGEKWRAALDAMEATLAPIDAPLLDALALDAPLRIADVACGGGGTTRRIAQRAPVGSVVHGYDISPALVEAARARDPSSAATFSVADAASTRPDPYDRLVSRFGTMFFEDPRAAFHNLAHWLLPGGRFAFAVWARTADNPWMSAIRDAVASVTRIPAPLPDAPGPFRYGDPAPLVALLEGAGLTDVEVQDVRASLPIGGGVPAEQASAFALHAFSSFAELLAAQGPDAMEAAHRALVPVLAGHEREGAVTLAARVHIVTGRRG